MTPPACLPTSDQVFGPRVYTSCRAFDFTLLFGDVFFACLPNAVFLLLLPLPITVLAKSPALCSVRSKLLLGKLVGSALALDHHDPAVDNHIGELSRRSYYTSNSPNPKITEACSPNKRFTSCRCTGDCWNRCCSMAFIS